MLTTMVGNYPKIGPSTQAPSLRRALAQFDEGRITLEELGRVEDQVTEEAIQEQIRAGLDLVTDGQMRWEDGQTYFARSIEGFSINGLIRYFDNNTYYRQPLAQARLRGTGPIALRDLEFAVAHSTVPVKAVLTGPYTLAKLSKNQYYPSFRDLVLELAEILNQEAKALEGAHPYLIQFDEPALVKNKGDFPLFQESMHRLTQGLTAATALYTYFGDVAGLAPEFFALPFEVFGLDFVSGPSNFGVLSDFPPEKKLGCGLLDARNTRLETVEEIVSALRRIIARVPMDRLHLHPSCGLEFLPRPTAYAKLVRTVEAARAAQEALP